MKIRQIAPYLPFLLAGPVTGPLAALALTSARRGQWARAALCGAAIPAFWVGAPAFWVWWITFFHMTGRH